MDGVLMRLRTRYKEMYRYHLNLRKPISEGYTTFRIAVKRFDVPCLWNEEPFCGIIFEMKIVVDCDYE